MLLRINEVENVGVVQRILGSSDVSVEFIFIEEARLRSEYALLYKQSPDLFRLPEWQQVSSWGVQRKGPDFKIGIYHLEDPERFQWQVECRWLEFPVEGSCSCYRQAESEVEAAWAEILRDLQSDTRFSPMENKLW